MTMCPGDAGVGKLLYSTVGCGEAEGAGTTGSLVELQAVMKDNPSKKLNTSINILVISNHWLSAQFLKPSKAHQVHETDKIL
jgi:hypothetical protein